MAFTQRIHDKKENANYNTSPLTISGLKGDSFDYPFMIACFNGGTRNEKLEVTFNSDIGNNYNYNNIGGQNTNRPQVDVSGTDHMEINRGSESGVRPVLIIGVIRGDSSQNRVMHVIHVTGDIRVYQAFNEWTDNVTELNSVTLTSAYNGLADWHVAMWEVPKLGNNDNWELVDEPLSWIASATEQSISGLLGDTDKFYKFNWDGDDVDYLGIEINNDAGNNYTTERFRNTGAAFSSTANNGPTMHTAKRNQGVIYAETGDERLGFLLGGGRAADKQATLACWYLDTITELTSLDCTPSAASTSEFKLFRPKYPNSCVPDLFDLPFKDVDQFSVNTADFTAGQSFTDLEGDKVLLFRIEFFGITDTGCNLRVNGDGGASDYSWQFLRGDGGTESANGDNADDNMLFLSDSNNDVEYSVCYMYPQTGGYRPTIGYRATDLTQIDLLGNYREDTVTEVTSIQAISQATGTINGTFKLSAIYL